MTRLTLALLCTAVAIAQDQDAERRWTDDCGGWMLGMGSPGDLSQPHPSLYGYALACGDLDGDGTSDLVLGAPGDAQGGWYTGSAEAWSGKTGKRLWRLNGLVERQCFGWSLAMLDDLDGDGCHEVAVGALFGNRVRIVSGKDGSTLRTLIGYDCGSVAWFGASLAVLGDLDGDGTGDLAVGSPRETWTWDSMGPDGYRPVTTGGVRVFSVKDGRSILDLGGLGYDKPGVSWTERIRQHYGSSIAAVGDVDQDGVPDFAVGAPGEPMAFFAGREPDHGPTAFCRPAHLEDLLAQPLREICIGRRPGRVWIHSGKDGKVLRELALDRAIDGFGCAVAGPGDLDGDGVPDVVAGSFRDTTVPEHGGSVTAFSGADGHPLWELHGHQPRSELGFSLAVVPDLDGDGVLDLAAGDPCEDNGMNSVGSVRLVSGRTGEELRTFHQGGPDDNVADFGFAIACPGDLDGDGSPELYASELSWFFGGSVFGLHASDGKPYRPLDHLDSW